MEDEELKLRAEARRRRILMNQGSRMSRIQPGDDDDKIKNKKNIYVNESIYVENTIEKEDINIENKKNELSVLNNNKMNNLRKIEILCRSGFCIFFPIFLHLINIKNGFSFFCIFEFLRISIFSYIYESIFKGGSIGSNYFNFFSHCYAFYIDFCVFITVWKTIQM
eukprot:GHVL01029212.1.p1 GENE.GHVL01029212.1~~GHVL01029212.1.p1  ORF type:complete len:166 (+),score=42.80 GHVL01029212.1:33-530(+)